MADRRLTYHESSMHHFRKTVRACEMKAICGRTFIRVEQLKAWVSGQMERLLEAAYQTGSQTHPALPISERQICSSHHCASLIFCILLEMGAGNKIHYFYRLGLYDSRLGDLDSGSLQQTLKRSSLGSEEGIDIGEFAKDFARRQWRYCPVKFELEDMNDCKHQQIIPIHKKEAINDKGFTASVWQVEVLEEFIGLPMRKVIATSRYTDSRDGLGQRYIIAQKTFEEGKRSFFEDEVKAFQALEGHGGFIRYLGDYSQRDFKHEKNTYNILLEYGERDLDEFFFDPGHLPPVLPAEIREFWAEIFAIAAAVKDLHSFKKQREGVSREFYGWHADIKPDNILRVKERFKLADPGFACFALSEGQARLGNREQTANIRGGTTTYGAPECHPGRKKRSPVPRSIDIWSLGCVFSVTATWVVLGDQGIRQFTILRERVVREKIEQARTAQLRNDLVTLQPGDYFHDGERVLEVVHNWHQHVRNSTRKTDTVTGRLLDLVDGHMLREKAEDRISAEDLCLKLGAVLEESQQEPIASLPESLRQALVQIDMSAPSAPSQTTALLDPRLIALGDEAIQDRKTRKSRLLDLPLMKTTHRSELLPQMPGDSPLPMPSLTHMPERNVPSLQAPWELPNDSSNGAIAQPAAEIVSSPGHPHNRLSPPRQPTLKKAPTFQSSIMSQGKVPSSPEQKKQNMWQVHEEIKPRKTLLGKYPKDAAMTKYFGDRDIQFLIDNADSMADHWAEAIYLLDALAMKASRQDEDGMDLCFTHGNVSTKGGKKPGTMIDKMKDPSARPDAHRGCRTDIRKKLGVLFRDYLSNVEKKGSGIRKLVVIIFTDGKWEAMTNKHDIERTIVEFVDKLKAAQNGYLDDRQVSFSFIRFGDDEEAKYRLRRLDDELIFQDIPDIVDTEESRGDVNKMLVGSFDEAYDSKNEFKPIPSNSGSNSDSYFDTEFLGQDSVLSQDQQSQSPPLMDKYAQQNTAYHYRPASGYAHSSPPAAHNRRPTPSIVLPQDSRQHSETYPGYSQ